MFCIDNLLIGGSYTVTETAPPPGYMLPAQTSQQTTVGNTATCGDPISAPDLTFRDPQVRGAIVVTKTAKSHAAGGAVPLPGATFQLLDSGGNTVGVLQATDGTGATCFANLPIGTYTVREVSAPIGYQRAGDVNGVSISTSSTCASNPVVVPVVDIPLSRIEVKFTSEAGPGVTAGVISCTGLSADSGSTTDDATFSDLVPGTYSCTVVVDP